MNYIEQLKTFTIDNLPDLDVVVMGALELFADNQLPTFDTKKFKRPLVVGSGNAAATGRILFADTDAVFATESTYKEKLKTIDSIDGVVLISASGSKHATRIAAEARMAELPVLLLTNTSNSPAAAALDPDASEVVVLPKNREPYTYNTSTYLGMILAATGEDPAAIKSFIDDQLTSLSLERLTDYDKFVLILPPQFAEVVPMLDVKFTELFGRQIARDIRTSEYMPHATTVVPAEELFVSFGQENTTWGEPDQRLYIPLPGDANYGAMIAIGYWLVGQIQRRQEDYFKQNIVDYTAKSSEVFGTDITPIVEK